MNKIVVASDSFKGSLSSMEVADAVEKGIRRVWPLCDVVKVNVADGGEGTTDALNSALGGEIANVTVQDPLMRPISARYAIAGDTAIIESASACGLSLLSVEERNPLLAGTFGLGEMILDALHRGCRRFLVGMGGSATNDAGTGMLSALGVRFLDAGGEVLEGRGENLSRIARIDVSDMNSAAASASFTLACDVDTTFCGPEGSAFVFSPQKGASPSQAAVLDAGMCSFAVLIHSQMGKDISLMKGAGAAGGLGGAFYAFLNARLVRGIDMVLDAISFDSLIEGADLVFTGEGRIDSQTPKGKTVCGILERAKRKSIPVVALAGSVTPCHEVDALGLNRVVAVSQGLDLSQAMRHDVASANVSAAAESVLKETEDYTIRFNSSL